MAATLPFPARFNAAEFFVDRNVEEGRGSSPAYYFQGAAISYTELLAGVNKAGNAFRQLDIRREERVALLLPDSPEFAYAFWGALKIGAVALPLNTFLSPADYEFMLRHSGAATLVVSAPLFPKVEPVLGRISTLRTIIVVEEDPPAEPGTVSWAKLFQDAAEDLPTAETTADDMAFWLYTSGTTGRQKAVVHRHAAPRYTAEFAGRSTLGLRADDIIFAIPRLFSCVALEWVFFFPALVGGAGLLCRDRPGPEGMPEIVRADRPTVVVAPVTFYGRMLRWAEEQKGSPDWSSVRLWMTGMESLPPVLAAGWRKRFGQRLLTHLGSTEAMMYVIARPGEELPGSVGKPVAGYDVKLVDDDSREVPVGEIGTLWIRGENVGHYWKNRAASLKVFHGEWFDTGDRYHQDAQRNLWFVGRADEMVRISGLWVAPSEVDDLLRGHPALDDAAFVGVPDELGVLRGVAFVVPRDGLPTAPGALEGELQEFARARLAHYKVPREFVFVSELPRTSSGKVQRFKLQDRYRELAGRGTGRGQGP